MDGPSIMTPAPYLTALRCVLELIADIEAMEAA